MRVGQVLGLQGQAILLVSLILPKLASCKFVPALLPFSEDRPHLPPVVVVVSGSLSFVDIDLNVASALSDLLEGAQCGIKGSPFSNLTDEVKMIKL